MSADEDLVAYFDSNPSLYTRDPDDDQKVIPKKARRASALQGVRKKEGDDLPGFPGDIVVTIEVQD